jgi:LuxR family maltose regulon positive regulatory protein
MLLQALIQDARGHRPEALAALVAALQLGQDKGYVRVFLDEGEPLARLLYAAVAQKLAPAYGSKLLGNFTFAEDEPGPPEELVEPLTPREQEVLAAVAEGLTNREIAQKLSIALGTVKVHTYNIYGKLGVGNRVEAVGLGRALGIL